MARWTEKELKILREMFDSTEPIAAQLHRLPNKSLENIQQTGRARGFKKAIAPTGRALIETLMADGVGRTAWEISKATGVTKTFCKDILLECVRSQALHVSSWKQTPLSAIYTRGPGEPAPRPAPDKRSTRLYRQIKKQQLRGVDLDDVDDALLDEAYSANATWWPRADPVVVNAIDAMVRCCRGRA